MENCTGKWKAKPSKNLKLFSTTERNLSKTLYAW